MASYAVIYITANEDIPQAQLLGAFPEKETAYNLAVKTFMDHVRTTVETDHDEKEIEPYLAISKKDVTKEEIFNELLQYEHKFFFKDAVTVLHLTGGPF